MSLRATAKQPSVIEEKRSSHRYDNHNSPICDIQEAMNLRAKTRCFAAPSRRNITTTRLSPLEMRFILSDLRPLSDVYWLTHELEVGKAQGKQKIERHR